MSLYQGGTSLTPEILNGIYAYVYCYLEPNDCNMNTKLEASTVITICIHVRSHNGDTI